MEINFNFDLNDWMAFQNDYLKNSKNYRKTKIIAIIILPFVLSLFMIIDYYKDELNPMSAVIFGLISILWIIFYPKRYDKRVIDKSRKMITEGDNSGTLGEHKIIFTDIEIIHIEPSSEHKIKWTSIKKINETKDYYFLYLTTISAIVIPKNKIETINELDKILKKNYAQGVYNT